MSKQRYSEEFKSEAIKQINEYGRTVADVSDHFGVSQHSLYQWLKVQRSFLEKEESQLSQSAELRYLKKELKRVTQERDILKKAATYFAKQIQMK
ncbi:transposase [Comamonas odontotermitis]|uniref:Transposase n=1 Tax=Comamonas odontotermitis TaxID=379895 RepID=A0ABR6RLN9_9BURK|nr:transposase [Comamonas odontotermitis]MBB6580072.1 transposase [Comamonas odontotermitis]